MIGEPGVLLEQGVDVRQLPLARAPPHHEHVVHDLVGALAVFADALEVVGHVAGDLLDQRAPIIVLLVVPLAEDLVQLFQEFLEQFLRYLREILDEVQRIPDLMSDARGGFAERRQLLAHDDLILSPV